MQRAKVKAFFREFPFLGGILNKNLVESVEVQRVDRNLMAAQSNIILGYDYYVLLDKEGSRLATVGVKPIKRRWYNPLTWSGRKSFCETVGDAIARLGDGAEQVFFVVYFDRQLFEQNSPPSPRLILYKLPKGFTLKGWLEEEIRREQVAIRAKSQAIDALAQPQQ